MISVITAVLVYSTLNVMLVRLMMQITRDIVRFSNDLDNPTYAIAPSLRGDEIGTAGRELASSRAKSPIR